MKVTNERKELALYELIPTTLSLFPGINLSYSGMLFFFTSINDMLMLGVF